MPEVKDGEGAGPGVLRKKSSGPRRQLPPKEEAKNDSPFGAIKLKKAETVKRTWDDGGLESVDLKHHEFEKVPLEELVSQIHKIVNTRVNCSSKS